MLFPCLFNHVVDAQSVRNILSTKNMTQNVIPNNITYTMLTRNDIASVLRNFDVLQLIPLNSMQFEQFLLF